MSGTCRRQVKMSPIWPRHACRGRHILTPTQDFCVGNCRHSHLPHYLLRAPLTSKYAPSLHVQHERIGIFLSRQSRSNQGGTRSNAECTITDLLQSDMLLIGMRFWYDVSNKFCAQKRVTVFVLDVFGRPGNGVDVCYYLPVAMELHEIQATLLHTLNSSPRMPREAPFSSGHRGCEFKPNQCVDVCWFFPTIHFCMLGVIYLICILPYICPRRTFFEPL